MRCAFCKHPETVGGGYAICENCKRWYHDTKLPRMDWTLMRRVLLKWSEKQ